VTQWDTCRRRIQDTFVTQNNYREGGYRHVMIQWDNYRDRNYRRSDKVSHIQREQMETHTVVIQWDNYRDKGDRHTVIQCDNYRDEETDIRRYSETTT
jgi:hypothetical protein